MLDRIARFCVRRRGLVLIAWVAVLVVLNVVANGIVGSNYRADMKLPDSESRDVQRQLEAANPDRAGFNAQIVFEAEQGVDDPQVQAAMEGLFAKVDQLDGVSVTSPYDPQGAAQVSKTKPIAFAELQVRDREYQEVVDLGTKIEDLGKDVHVQGLTVEYGGDMFSKFEMPESEALGLLAAVIILLIAFGSVLAMGLPIVTALFGLGHRCGAHRAHQQRAVDAELRAAAHRDDRPRRRHRLRAVHRHPLPRGPARGHGAGRRDRGRGRHVGSRGAVRGRDRDHLAAWACTSWASRSCAASRPAPRSACSS